MKIRFSPIIAALITSFAALRYAAAQAPVSEPPPIPPEAPPRPANISPPMAPPAAASSPAAAPAEPAPPPGEEASVPPISEAPAPQIPDKTIVEPQGLHEPDWRKHFFPHFRLGGYYDDNIFIQNKDKQSDFVGFAGFGLRAGIGEVQAPLYTLRETRNVPQLYEAPPQPIGNFILADYSGTFFAFSNNSSEDSYDQDALLSLGWSDGKLSLGFEGRFQSLSSSDIDVGNRVRRDILSAAVNGRYDFSEKSSLENNFSFTATEYDSLISSHEWTDDVWFNYQITPKIKLSPGIGVGLLQIENSSDQPYVDLLMRSVYQASEKVSFTGRIGFEYRDVGGDSSLRYNPIFGLGATYTPFDGTALSLDGYRVTEASAILAGEDYARTGVSLQLRQRFLDRFYLTLTGGYENLDYSEVEGNGASDRTDNYFFGRVAVAFDVTKWCNAEIFYNHQRDASTQSDQSFTDNQIGFEFDFAF